MAVRRQSQGFSRGTSTYRGVTHHPSGRWEARIGVPGSKHIYLGLFNEEKEAAQAYDSALVRLRGTAAATNFALSDYRQNLAEYHKMQQTVLQSSQDQAALLVSGQDYEQWIRHGSMADHPMDSASNMEEPAQVSTATGVGRMLKAKSRQKSEAEAKPGSSRGDGAVVHAVISSHSDSDEPISDGDQTESDVPHRTHRATTAKTTGSH